MRAAGKKNVILVMSLAVAMAVVCLVTVRGAGSAVAGEPVADRGQDSPVGSWSAAVVRSGVTEQISLQFASTGRACLITSAGLSKGTWTATGTNRFNWRIKEPLVDETGTQTGWIDINQDAVQAKNTFHSSGTSLVFDLNGNLLNTVQATVSGQRVSKKDPPCA